MRIAWQSGAGNGCASRQSSRVCRLLSHLSSGKGRPPEQCRFDRLDMEAHRLRGAVRVAILQGGEDLRVMRAILAAAIFRERLALELDPAFRLRMTCKISCMLTRSWFRVAANIREWN
jgi:hypothetical protein